MSSGSIPLKKVRLYAQGDVSEQGRQLFLGSRVPQPVHDVEEVRIPGGEPFPDCQIVDEEVTHLMGKVHPPLGLIVVGIDKNDTHTAVGEDAAVKAAVRKSSQLCRCFGAEESVEVGRA